MKDYEKSFIEKMDAARQSGLSFRTLVENGARARLGEVPGDIFLRSLSKAARLDPGYFVRETSKIFGGGAQSMYESVLHQAEMGRTSLPPSSYEMVVQELAESLRAAPEIARVSSPSPRPKGLRTLLHLFRVMDEEGNFPDIHY